MKILNLSQNGPDWLQWRAGGIGGSDAPVISGDSPYVTPEQLLASKSEVGGNKKVIKENARMKRGKRLEPVARIKYMEVTGIRVRPVCIVHEEHDWLRASLDGLSFPPGPLTALEIKCPSDFTHETALSGEVPSHYKPQVQHILLACRGQVDYLHYFSYTDSRRFKPEERFALVKVQPDPEYMDWLFERERKWWLDHGGPRA